MVIRYLYRRCTLIFNWLGCNLFVLLSSLFVCFFSSYIVKFTYIYIITMVKGIHNTQDYTQISKYTTFESNVEIISSDVRFN